MIYKIFYEHVLIQPDAIAIVTSDGQSYTYSSANERVDQWAYYLLSRGVNSGDRVGVLLNNEDHHVFIYLALDRINACYVPFDTDIPKQQLVFDLNVLNVKIFLIEACLREIYAIDSRLEVPFLAEDLTELDAEERQQLRAISYDDNGHEKISYCVSSSGTTGDKKWIPILGAGLIYWANLLKRLLSLTSSSSLLATRSPAYDARVFEYVCAFSGGGSLHLLDKFERKNLPGILNACKTASIRCIILIASQLGVDNAEQVISTLKKNGLIHLMVTGDTCTPYLKLMCERHDVNLWNGYGPTEATFGLSILRVNGLPLFQMRGMSIVPIGKPDGEEVRCSLLRGNLLIESPYLTPGYLNQAANDAVFKVQTTSESKSIRLFDTGDAFSESNGFLFFHGRSTLGGHCKINGVKITPVYIERCLSGYNDELQQSIVQVAVVIKPYLDKNRVFAYLVVTRDFNASTFRQYVKNRLKIEEMPLFVRMDALPQLHPSDKIDRQALIARKDNVTDFFLQEGDVAIRSHHHTVKNIWKTVLRQESISEDVELMFLGGNSIDLAHMVQLIQTQIDPAYTYSTISKLETITIHTVTISLTKERPLTYDSALIYPLVKTLEQKSNIFFLPALLGEGCFSYRHLSQRIAQLHDKHIYGLSDPGIIDDTLCPQSLAHAASRYILAIKTVQPTGPYGLLGFSFGSTLAFEVAKQLMEQGETVSDLLLVDGFPPMLYQQLPVVEYGRSLQTLLQLVVTILSNEFYAENIKTFNFKWNLNLTKAAQLELGFNQIEKELKNTVSINMLRMAKWHLSLILNAPLPDKKLFLCASFYRTRVGQDYLNIINQIPGLSKQSSDYGYYFWNRYVTEITGSRLPLNCDHLDVLTQVGASYLQKLILFVEDRFLPIYRLQRVKAKTQRLTLFFINRQERHAYLQVLYEMGLFPEVLFHDQHLRQRLTGERVYTSQVTLVCDVPTINVEAVLGWLATKNIPRNRPDKAFFLSESFGIERVRERGYVVLNLNLDECQLVTLTFNYYSFAVDIINALQVLRAHYKVTLNNNNLEIKCNLSSQLGINTTLRMVTNFLADFITILNAHMVPEPYSDTTFAP